MLCGVLPLVRHVGARRVRVSADVRVEWPERRGSVACREMWERRGRGLVAGAAAAVGVVAWGRYWGGRGVLPPACHVGAKQVCVSADVRVEWPERRGSVVCREMRERRGWCLGAGVAAAAGVVALRSRRAAYARIEFERFGGWRRRC